MTDFADEHVFSRLWQVSHELPETGETVVFDAGRSELLVLNPIGGAIWELLDGARSVSDIVSVLVAEVESAPSSGEVAIEVRRFLSDMVARGAIR